MCIFKKNKNMFTGFLSFVEFGNILLGKVLEAPTNEPLQNFKYMLHCIWILAGEHFNAKKGPY